MNTSFSGRVRQLTNKLIKRLINPLIYCTINQSIDQVINTSMTQPLHQQKPTQQPTKQQANQKNNRYSYLWIVSPRTPAIAHPEHPVAKAIGPDGFVIELYQHSGADVCVSVLLDDIISTTGHYNTSVCCVLYKKSKHKTARYRVKANEGVAVFLFVSCTYRVHPQLYFILDT